MPHLVKAYSRPHAQAQDGLDAIITRSRLFTLRFSRLSLTLAFNLIALSFIMSLTPLGSLYAEPQAEPQAEPSPSQTAPQVVAPQKRALKSAPLYKLDERAEQRAQWALELQRWPRVCTRRAERPQDGALSGCQTWRDAALGYAAIYRARRVGGFIETIPNEPEASVVASQLSDTRLSALKTGERVALLALCDEALRATGDRAWLDLSRRVTASSPLLTAELKPFVLGEEVVDELIALLSAAQRSQHDGVSPPLITSEQRARLIERARALAAPHLSGALSSDRKRGSSSSWWARRASLAALSLSAEELSAWWGAEQASPADLKPLSGLKRGQWGINSARASGIAALLTYLEYKTAQGALKHPLNALTLKTLRDAYHAHARATLELYIAQRRNYRDYGSRVPAQTLLAITTDRAPSALMLSVPPSRWITPGSAPLASTRALESTPLRASGMFSKIALRDQGTRRGLYFVRPNGAELLETEVDLARPDLLRVRYTQDLLAAYTLLPQPPKRALLIGLGGGAMVHALHAYDPQLKLDVVEIDPVVVRLAREYFGVSALESTPNSNIKVITEDGFDYLKRDHPHRYDIIWMDAFLQPTAETDSAGSPLNLKTRDFLRDLAQRHLTLGGAIAININAHAHERRDFDAVRAAFKTSSIWRVPQTGNYVALGLNGELKESADQLRRSARALTARHATPFRYELLLERALKQLSPQLR